MGCDSQFDFLYEERRCSETYHNNLARDDNRTFQAERGQTSVCEHCNTDFGWPASKSAELRRLYLLRESQQELAKLRRRTLDTQANIDILENATRAATQRNEQVKQLNEELTGLKTSLKQPKQMKGLKVWRLLSAARERFFFNLEEAKAAGLGIQLATKDGRCPTYDWAPLELEEFGPDTLSLWMDGKYTTGWTIEPIWIEHLDPEELTATQRIREINTELATLESS